MKYFILFSSFLLANSTDTCIACHGEHGEKSAFDKTKIIKNMNREEFISIMKDYRAGHRNLYGMGGSMRKICNKSDEDIEEIAKYFIK